MKSIFKILCSIFFLLSISVNSYAYIVTGTIVDEKDKPIWKAEITGRNSINKVKIGLETDQLGRFTSININDSTLSIEIIKDGYTPVYMYITGTTDKYIDLGVVKLKLHSVELDEVTVTAQPVIQKPDKYIIIPSVGEIEQSANGLSLLNNLQFKMPGLIVIESLQSVKVDNKTPIFKINGKPSSLSHFLALNPKDVLRIEYHDVPDIRYNNRQIINVFLKPREDGGTLASNLNSAVSTGCINGNLGINYHSGKSEWDLKYQVGWRDYDEREIISEGDFIGRDEKIIRKRNGTPSPFNMLQNNLYLGYSYMHNPNTVFMAQLNFVTESMKLDDNSLNIQTYKDETLKYSNQTHRNNNFSSPGIDIFFRKQIDKTQYIEANAYGSFSSGDYERDYIDKYDLESRNDAVSTFTTNKSWRAGFEFLYSKAFRHLTTNFGAHNYYNSAHNEQKENSRIENDKINQNRLSVYGQVFGKIGKLRYSLSVNGVHNHSDNNSYKVNAFRFKTNVNMNLPLSRYVTLNYLLMYDPSMPSIYQQSNMIQTIDDILVRQGNPNLKPSEYLRNRIYVRYAYKKFTGSLWMSHSRTFNPIYYAYSYVGDVSSPYYDKFMSSPINGNDDDLINLELNLSVQDLFGFATIWGKLGWDYYNIDAPKGSYTKNRLYASLNGSLKFGKWVVSANYVIAPRYNLSGNVFSTTERWNTVSVQYNYKNWYFTVIGNNLFTKRGATFETITVSDVHPEKYMQNIRDNANMVMLSINYRIDFGKKYKRSNRTLNNGGVDKGLDSNY